MKPMKRRPNHRNDTHGPIGKKSKTIVSVDGSEVSRKYNQFNPFPNKQKTAQSPSRNKFQRYKPRRNVGRVYDPINNPDPFHYMNPVLKKETQMKDYANLK